MSDGQAEVEKLGSGSSEDSGSQRAEIFDRPTGWRAYYYHPVAQISMLGLVCFVCPGMFNALSGLGGGGQVNAKDQANANASLSATFAFFGFFSGTVNNVIGPRRTLMLGTWGYSLYIAAFLAVNIHAGAGDFVVASGAILGVCAAFLWSAQGSLMMSYPTEAQKGMYIGIFWAIFNLGAVVGAAVAFALNFNNTVVGNGTYVGFLILTLIGVFLPLFMADPDKMVRTDGTRVNLVRHPSWKTEFLSLFIALKTDPWIVLLFPMFLASNYFYTWQFNDYNGALFTIRARGLNNFMYWTSQIFGSVFIGYFVLDQTKVRRRVRAFYGWVLVFLMIFVVHTWAYFYQKTYTRLGEAAQGAYKIDIYDSNYAAHVWLMIFYGFLDSMWQTYAYWLMGAMSNDPAKLAVFAGFCAYMNIFLSTWCLTVAGMIFAAPMVYIRVTDHTDIEDEVL
ncbi:MFS general substrate transporter [Suillus subluteus]|nr:MFS general substrate transporter [Suillus subluteus]